MTMIDGTPARDYLDNKVSMDIDTQLKAQEQTIDRLTKTLFEERSNVRALFEQLNDYIRDNELTIENQISLEDLDEMLLKAFTHRMTFTQEYEVQLEHIIHTTLTITASSEEEARQMAEEIGITDEPAFDLPYECDVTEWVLADTRTLYSGRKQHDDQKR